MITTDTKMIPTISHRYLPIIIIFIHCTAQRRNTDNPAAAAFQLQSDDRKDEHSPLPLSDSVARLFLYLFLRTKLTL